MHKWGIGLVEEALVLLNRHANVACVGCFAGLRPLTLRDLASRARAEGGMEHEALAAQAVSRKDGESAAIPRVVDIPLAA